MSAMRNELVQLAIEESFKLSAARRAAVLRATADIIGDPREAKILAALAAALDEVDRKQRDLLAAFVASNTPTP